MTPGNNILNRALRLIGSRPIQYLQATGRTQNAARQYVPTFATPVTINASVQAVGRAVYNELGLNLQKNYIKIFITTGVINLARDTSGDRFIFNGRQYQVENEADWYVMDGWTSCIAVDVGSSTGSIF